MPPAESFGSLTPDVAARIAALLDAPLREEPYRAGGGPVYRLSISSLALNIDIALLLWTSLSRADVRIGDSSLVFKQIDSIELYPGVEVLFRRLNPPGYLFVSVGGRVSMVA